MEKKDRIKWTQKFRELGKKKGSRKDFVKLYKEMKSFKDENKKELNQGKKENDKYIEDDYDIDWKV